MLEKRTTQKAALRPQHLIYPISPPSHLSPLTAARRTTRRSVHKEEAKTIQPSHGPRVRLRRSVPLAGPSLSNMPFVPIRPAPLNIQPPARTQPC